MLKIKNLRWLVCGLLFIATSLSFLDRQVLSLVTPQVTEEFQMSNIALSRVLNGFLLSYTIMFFLGGRLIDRLGTRLGMALSVGFWSLASAVHGIVQNPMQLGAARFFLGVGEGGCFPGATKGAAEWFSSRERATAIGIAIGGAAFGAAIASPMTNLWLVPWVGWRGAFFATGIIGGIWVLLWLIFFHKPQDSPFITDRELAHIANSHGKAAVEVSERLNKESIVPLKVLLRVKQVWGLALMRFLVDWVFYFYMFWIPLYLSQERNVSRERIGKLFWIPWVALGISNIAGGWISDRLIKSGISVNTARKSIMTIAAVLTIPSLLAPYVPSAEWAIFCMSMLMFAHGFWITNYVTIITEIFDSNSVGTVMGLAGAIGGIGGILATHLIGVVSAHFSYLPVWIASGIMYPLALVVLFLTIGPIRRVELPH